MIDEKVLDDLESLLKLHPNGTHAVFVEKKSEGAWAFDSEVLSELIRLARLGLWAKEHALPTLNGAHNHACGCCDSSDSVKEHCDKALAELPSGNPS